ncbi:MAG: transposase [bacterium]|nr:transposase [bacterium]
MLRESRAVGELYHVYNRGNDRRDIFLDERDRARFLLSLLFLQTFDAPDKLDRLVTKFLNQGALPYSPEEAARAMRTPLVHVVAFALMPNHFHLLLMEQRGGGISKYLQRLLISYTKYFNTKRERDGHVLQGAYRSVHIEDDAQLLHCSAYIHRNPRDLPRWHGKEHLYPWSSYQDYVSGSRWGAFLQPGIVLSQFANQGKRYQRYVEQSGAKDRLMDPVLLIDRDEPIRTQTRVVQGVLLS